MIRRYLAMRDALTLIGGCGCEHFTRGSCTEPNSGKLRGSLEGWNAWCDACIALTALGLPTARPRRVAP